MSIQKICVVGNAGGGKTTLSRKLAKAHGLPLTCVDSIQFVAGLKIRPHRESIQILSGIQNEDSWIIDGFGPLDIIEKRFQAADVVVFVDFPLWRHYWWAAKRQIQNLFSKRAELPEDCSELSWTHAVKLFKTIGQIHHKMRPELLRIFARENLRKKVIHIQNISDWNRVSKGITGVDSTQS